VSGMKLFFGPSPTLMGKLIRYFLVIIVMMFLLNMYSMIGYRGFYRDFYTVLRNLVDVHSISAEVDTMYRQVENYVSSGSLEYLTVYRSRYTRLYRHIEGLKHSNQETYFPLHDIQNMALSFHQAAERTIQGYDSGLARIYVNQSLAELARLKGYIDSEVKNLLIDLLFSAQSYYSVFGQEMQYKAYMVYLMTGLITALCILIAIRFSREISVPIHDLVLRLKKVGQGDLHVEAMDLKNNDEVNFLIKSFNTMVSDIRHMIDAMREKATVEQKLREQEIKYLEMSNLLNQSELKFLQSQINPHFLFNTMNSIEVLAEIEQAHQTHHMLKSLSGIIRHSLKNISGSVTLQEEYEIVKNYLYIQGVRFGNRFTYHFVVDSEVLCHRVPSMILQPFIENAIIHGLEPKEGKGTLKLLIKDEGDYIGITIDDDGVGFSMEQLLQMKRQPERFIKDTRDGIGIYNVVRRLEIEYGQNVVDIQSTEGEGTRIAIRLYKTAA